MRRKFSTNALHNNWNCQGSGTAKINKNVQPIRAGLLFQPVSQILEPPNMLKTCKKGRINEGLFTRALYCIPTN